MYPPNVLHAKVKMPSACLDSPVKGSMAFVTLHISSLAL